MRVQQWLRHWQRYYLPLAGVAVLLTVVMPGIEANRAVFTHIVIVDITRSINVLDYSAADGSGSISRLAFIKQALHQSLLDLPCGSRMGLGVFTERHSTLLFAPIEVCQGFQDIDQAIQHLDWRMAWAADSRISSGLSNTLDWMQLFEANLVFITDGQEAPPINPRYKVTFDEVRGNVKGILVGVGGLRPAPIPKFNYDGQQTGFYAESDVPQRSTFGLSSQKPEAIEGYNARNAPFGKEVVSGGEHLSSLKEAYLKALSQESGLGYHRLQTLDGFSAALQNPHLAEQRTVTTDIRWIAAGLGILLLLLRHFSYLTQNSS